MVDRLVEIMEELGINTYTVAFMSGLSKKDLDGIVYRDEPMTREVKVGLKKFLSAVDNNYGFITD